MGAGRQGVLVEGEPGLPGQARDQGGNPGQGRPGHRSSRKGSSGGRPPNFDKQCSDPEGGEPLEQGATADSAGQGSGRGRHAFWERNTVERAVNKLRGCRATATRYEKRNYTYLGTIAVTSIWIWLRNPTESTLSDTA